MRLGCGAFCALASLAAAPLVQAQEGPVHLNPVSPWALDYADDSCRLVRTFGTGANEVTLGLASSETGGRFVLSAVGELTRPARNADTVTVAMGDIERMKVRFLRADFAGRPGLIFTNPISIGPVTQEVIRQLQAALPLASFSQPEVEAAVTTIGFVDGLEREFVAHTGSMREPMQALKDCNAELVTHWNIDQQAHKSLTRGVIPKSAPFSWLKARAYPRELRQATFITYRLIVDNAGAVADCAVIGAAKDAPFTKATCAQLQANARFEPALDANGKPVRSYFVFWTTLNP